MPPTTGTIKPALISWLLRSLGRESTPWSAEQSAYLESIMETEEGARILASLVVTTLRLRQSALFKPDSHGTAGTILPAIEAFWQDPTSQTYRELRIARW
ncbi:MAG TPA: hypothetical protein VFW45_13805 [Candidatus Polarisedimenticolia bacterium]|nr:hypothetical protein [Candidatus Polarisedimenticolia bacterium]